MPTLTGHVSSPLSLNLANSSLEQDTSKRTLRSPCSNTGTSVPGTPSGGEYLTHHHVLPSRSEAASPAYDRLSPIATTGPGNSENAGSIITDNSSSSGEKVVIYSSYQSQLDCHTNKIPSQHLSPSPVQQQVSLLPTASYPHMPLHPHSHQQQVCSPVGHSNLLSLQAGAAKTSSTPMVSLHAMCVCEC